MRRRLIPIGVCLVAATVWGDRLTACGEKFLVVSRGTRFQRAAPLRNATILVYANPKSAMQDVVAGLSMDATLKKVGYRPTITSTADELDNAIARGGWNLVVADVAEMKAIQARLQNVPALAVLPAKGVTNDDLKTAKRQYACVLKTPTRTQAFLDAVDEALSAKPSSRSAGKSN